MMKSKRARLLAGLLASAVCVLGLNASAALALSPSVETLAATSIAEKGATLNGKVNPNGAETKMYFEYGTTTSYGSKTAELNVGSGSTTLEKSQAISGLTGNTLYHYRIVATNSSGTSQGADKTFTTTGVPSISGYSATVESSGEAATLKASVDPNGQSTTYQYEYGPISNPYTQVVPIPEASAGSGFEPVAVEQKITGLTPGERYQWRISATNAGGKVTGYALFPFGSNHPGIETVTAFDLGRTAASLGATIKPRGSATTYYFEYGTTASYGTKTTTKEISGAVESKAVSEAITGLKANTLYHYRIVASNATGTHTGPDQTFTTLTTATLYPAGKGEAIKTGTTVTVFSNNLKFSGESGSHSCNEAMFSGPLKENPGALQSVTLFRFQQTFANCPWGGATIKYTTPEVTLEYAKNGSGEAFVRTGKFVLVQTVYSGVTKVGECEYNLSLSGSFKTGSAATTLSGATEVVKTSGTCPGAESVSGEFGVSSGADWVEVK